MAYTDPATAVTGTLAPASIWNTGVRDNFRALMHPIVRKPSDESVSNNTLQADDHLIVPVGANETWRLDWELWWSAESAGNMNFDHTFPTGGRIIYTFIRQLVGGGGLAATPMDASTSPTTTIAIATDIVSGGIQITRIPMRYIGGANAGNITLRWSQNTTFGTATIMRADSMVWGTRLSP